jgi:hypothetical protein
MLKNLLHVNKLPTTIIIEQLNPKKTTLYIILCHMQLAMQET